MESDTQSKIKSIKKKHAETIERLKELAKNIIEKPRVIMPTILASNLYLENAMNKVIEENFKKPNLILKYSFLQKITVLNSIGILKNEYYLALKTMNELRNLYAHELFVSDEKIKLKISSLKKYDKSDKSNLDNRVKSISTNLIHEIIDDVYALK